MRRIQFLLLLSMLTAGVGLGVWAPWTTDRVVETSEPADAATTLELDLQGGSRVVLVDGPDLSPSELADLMRHLPTESAELIRKAAQLQAWAAQDDPQVSALAEACKDVTDAGYFLGTTDLQTFRLNNRVALICHNVHKGIGIMTAEQWAAEVNDQLRLRPIGAP